MAHLRSIRHTCDAMGCARPAVSEVYNYQNAACGRYCGKHATAAVKKLQRDEDASFARAQEGRVGGEARRAMERRNG